MKTYRLPASQEIYEREMEKMEGETECRLCKLLNSVKRTIGNFVIVPNEYPYDAVSDVNDMIMLKEHREHLIGSELRELETIKKILSNEGYYDLLMENLAFKLSVKNHWHIQILRRNEAHL